MAVADGFFIYRDDPTIDRVSALVTPDKVPARFSSELAQTAARIATDVTVIRSSLLTLVIVESTFPVLPLHYKAVAVCSGMLAALSLVAASADIVVQLGKIDIPFGLLGAVPGKDLDETAGRLEDLMDPTGKAMESAFEYLGKMGLLDADLAKLSLYLKAFTDAKTAAKAAQKSSEKMLHGLAALDAAKKFFEKFLEEAKKRSEKEEKRKDDEKERRERERLLEEKKPLFPGVDYPNPGGGGQLPGVGDGGTQVAKERVWRR